MSRNFGQASTYFDAYLQFLHNSYYRIGNNVWIIESKKNVILKKKKKGREKQLVWEK